jgi:hypothetical protein
LVIKKGNMNYSSHSVARGEKQTSKLVSLLALATGAVAMPQTGQADIIYTDLSSSPALVGFAASPIFTFNVPGSAQVGFARTLGKGYTSPGSLTVYFRSVIAGQVGGGAEAGVRALGGGFVAPQALGATWSAAPASLLSAAVGTANDLNFYGGRRPASDYNNQYLAWYFVDDSIGGSPRRYGWVELSLSIAGYNAGGPLVTVLRYGYDNTGAKPTMGQLPVPEPSSGALLALGAMALGSRGLRKWRQQKESVPQS